MIYRRSHQLVRKELLIRAFFSYDPVISNNLSYNRELRQAMFHAGLATKLIDYLLTVSVSWLLNLR